jgi:large repetitive protein
MSNPINKIQRLLFFMMVMVCSSPAWSQNVEERNWFFGDGSKVIQFARPDYDPKIINRSGGAISYGAAGSAVATDANTGNLLFYTDGDIVYDVSNRPMPGGGLGGNTGINQPAVIAPVPGTPNQYYVFTITAGGTVEQAIIQMDAFGNAVFPAPPLGDVLSKNVATGLTNSAEAMIIIPNPNGDESWLITQSANSDTYTVTAITAGGLVSTTFPGNGIPLTAANFSSHKNPDGTFKIAVSPKDPNKNVVIFDFYPTSGVLNFNNTLSNYLLGTATTSTTGESIYDTEWSITGDTLYISKNGDLGAGIAPDVLQVVLTGPVISPVSVLPPTIPLDIVKSYGLQMGPDGVIYHLYENSAGELLMGSIEDTDGIGPLQVTYTPEAFMNGNNSIDFNTKQFPSFSPPAKTTYTLTFTTVGSNCTNSPITLFPTITPGADSIVWDFGDGTTATSWSPIHTFTTAGPTVTATAYVNGIPVVTSPPQTLALTQFDGQLTVQSDTTACSCELTFPKAPNPPPHCKDFTIEPQFSGSGSPTYQWYGPSGLLTAKTSKDLTKVDSAGFYYVVATVGGCSVSAGQTVNEYHVQDMRANKWHFGTNAGINFNPLFYTPPKNRPAQPITGPINSTEGVATISDANGQVILSTDGYQVYDRAGNPLIPSAPTAPVSPIATQSALIIPVPGDNTLYYIFTAEPVESGTYRVSYMLFDLKVLPNGAIVDPDANAATDPRITLFEKSTERLTGNDNWLIAHDYGNNSFRMYPVSTDGLGAPVITDIGSDHSTTTANSAQGYMKLGPQNRLAVALNDGSSNTIELFDFVDSTGTLTNFRKIDLNDPAGQIYGVEFSPGGNKLYATVKNGATSIIYEYAIDSLGVATFLQKTAPITGELGDMQIGPDGQIYIAVNGSSSLLFFQPDEDITQPTAALNSLQTFSLTDPVSGVTNTSTLGLPNFIQTVGSPLQTPGMSVVGNCPNMPVSFSATPSDQYRDEYTWLVKGPGGAFVTSSTEQTFQHTFTTPGTYTVSLDITSDCMYPTNLVARFSRTLVIDVPPANPTFLIPPDNNVMCSPTKLLEATPNATNLSFLWTTTEITNQITVTQAGSYGVTITDNATGCTSNGSINILDNRPTVDLGPDFPICSDVTSTLDAGNPASTFIWQIDNGATASTAQQLAVNTTLLGTHEYKVTVTNSSGCSDSDEVLITVNPIPTFTETVLTQPACGASTGEVRVDITSAGTFTVDFSGPSANNVRFNQPIGAVLPTYQNLAAGTYNVIVTNDVTGCDTQDAVGLNNIGFTVNPVYTSPSCTPVTVTVQRTLGGTGSLTYKFTNTINNQVIGPFTDNTGVAFVTPAIDPGSYVLEVKDASNCITTANVDILQNAPVTFDLDADCGTVEVINLAVANFTYTWSSTGVGPGITPTADPYKVTINPNTPATASRTISVTVTDPTSASCPATKSIDVIVDNNTPTSVSGGGDYCVPTATLTASPGGAYTYTWSDLNNSTGQILTTSTSGQYTVNIVSNASGCPLAPASATVNFLGTLTISLATTLPCADQEFTLTATVVPSNATITWERNNLPITKPNPFVEVLPEHVTVKYKAIATLGGCTPVSDEKDISAGHVDTGNLPVQATICDEDAAPIKDQQVELNTGVGSSGTFEWFKNNVLLTDETSDKLIAKSPGLYQVNFTNLSGCTGSDKTQVIKDCKPALEAPNAFMPDHASDDDNKVFKVFPRFVSPEDFNIFIFNRWGEMVFQTSVLDFTWDGTYKGTGAPLPPGTYSWVAKYKSEFDSKKSQEKHGGVVLLR